MTDRRSFLLIEQITILRLNAAGNYQRAAPRTNCSQDRDKAAGKYLYRAHAIANHSTPAEALFEMSIAAKIVIAAVNRCGYAAGGSGAIADRLAAISKSPISR